MFPTCMLYYLLLISAFCSAISYFWGAMSDSFGYKRVLITCNVLLGVMSALFGLSVSISMAIVTRFLLGLVNGEFC